MNGGPSAPDGPGPEATGDLPAVPEAAPSGVPEAARYWQARYSNAGRVWGDDPSELARFTVARLRPLASPDLAVVDLGCGYGRDSIHLAAALGCRVHGIDPAPAAVVEATAAAPAGLDVTFEAADAASLAAAVPASSLVTPPSWPARPRSSAGEGGVQNRAPGEVVARGRPRRASRGYQVTTDRQVHEMANRSTASSIDEYIAEFPAETQKVLEELRALIRASAPDATETISYAIPTFDLNGKHLVHFAGYAKHIGFYPVPSAMDAFKDELEPYRSGKGSAQFPLGQPLPADLIRRIVEFRVDENTRKAST